MVAEKSNKAVRAPRPWGQTRKVCRDGTDAPGLITVCQEKRATYLLTGDGRFVKAGVLFVNTGLRLVKTGVLLMNTGVRLVKIGVLLVKRGVVFMNRGVRFVNIGVRLVKIGVWFGKACT